MGKGKVDSHQLQKSGFSKDNGVIYLTDDENAKLKSILLKMLSDINAVADKHQLFYTLSGGSVIGAVRHKGFIPWDDDIDINITRKDFDKLVEIFDTELGEDYELCYPEKTHNHGMLVSQIKKKGTVYRSFNELSKNKEDCGIYVDVYVIENVYNNVILRQFQSCLSLAVGYLTGCRKMCLDYPLMVKYLDPNSRAIKTFKRKAFFGKLISFISVDTMTRFGNSVYKMCKDNNSKFVTIPCGRGHFVKEMQPRDVLCKRKQAIFANTSSYIPNDANKYLSKLYGEDYMVLPPAEKREQHPLMEIDFGEN